MYHMVLWQDFLFLPHSLTEKNELHIELEILVHQKKANSKMYFMIDFTVICTPSAFHKGEGGNYKYHLYIQKYLF